MEQKRENEDEETPYTSRLLQNKETIPWNILNLREIEKLNCWTAMSFSFACRGSLGRDYTWRVSLDMVDDYLYGRVEIMLPLKHRIPYSMKFILKRPDYESLRDIEYRNLVREITNGSEPQRWKIMSRQHVLRLLNNAEDLLEINVEITTYGSETTQGLNAQNYPV